MENDDFINLDEMDEALSAKLFSQAFCMEAV